MSHKTPQARNKYQAGTLEKRRTSFGLCWYLRHFERYADGTKKRVRTRIGFVSDLPTKAAAERVAAKLRVTINEREKPLDHAHTMQDVIDRYRSEEMPERHATRRGYEIILRNHIVKRWGPEPLTSIRPADVRDWLRNLKVSTKYRGNIHGVMRILFRFSMLWEWIPVSTNPMSLFRLEGSTKRSREPRSLTLEEFLRVVDELNAQVYKTMVLVAGSTGLRCSELFALRWEDIDFGNLTLRIERGIVDQVLGSVKTYHSKKKLPLDPLLATVLLDFQRVSEFRSGSDWIFASPWLAGELPYRPNNVQRRTLVPAGKRAGLDFSLGWHTFRHSYRSWLEERGVPLTVQRDLMRHADIRTTAQVYGGVNEKQLRCANSDLVGDLMKRGSE